MVADGYKKTEIGVIPVEWEVVELEKGCNKIVGGGTPSKNNNSYWENGTILWATPTEFTKNNSRYISTTILKITQDGLENSSATLLKKGTVIMSSRATIGECKINTIEMTTNQGFISYECNEKLNNIFLLYLIGRYKSKIIKVSSGSTFLEVSKTTMRNFKIPLPPLKEQEKIADILSTADEKIDAIEEQIQKAETLKKGLLQKLLSEGIGHSKFKDSELGKIPESWEVKSLSMIGSFSKGKGISKNEIIEDGIPCMRYAEIYTEYDIVLKNIKSFIDEKSALNSKRINKGDILFAGSGETLDDIGKSVAFIDDFEAYVGGDTVILSPSIAYNSLFMSYQLNSTIVRLQLRKLGQGSSVVHIYSSGLEKVKVPFPPLKEQKQIADILSTADEKLEVLRAKKQMYEILKKGLLQKLLSGEVRVSYD